MTTQIESQLHFTARSNPEKTGVFTNEYSSASDTTNHLTINCQGTTER